MTGRRNINENWRHSSREGKTKIHVDREDTMKMIYIWIQRVSRGRAAFLIQSLWGAEHYIIDSQKLRGKLRL